MKKIIFFLISVIIYSLWSSTAYGQEQFLLKGRITSSTDGSGLPGAAVVELDKNNRVVRGVITDMDGNYALMITNKNNKVQASFIGYKLQVVDIQGRNNIEISLDEDVAMISGVDVYAERRTNTGFINVEDRDLAIPVEKMNTREIEDVQAASIDEAIQGRLAGVDIVSNSGNPGSGMSVRIRGVSSLRPNQDPLIVVDGVPYPVTIEEDFNFATSNEEEYSQMLNIPVSDIKEISVLKDAAGTALYGSAAVNGVLLITTKRGVAGQAPTVSYSYRGSFTEQPKIMPMLNGDEYVTYVFEGYMNSFNFPLVTQDRLEFSNDPTQEYYYYNYGQNTNWVKAIQKNGFTNNHDFSISGGGEKARYRFSVNYLDDEGTSIGNFYNRLTNRLNLDYDISDKLKISADFSYARGERGSDYDKYMRNKAYKKMPNMSIYEWGQNPVTGEWEETPNYFSPRSNVQGGYEAKSDGGAKDAGTYNIVAMANEATNNTLNNSLNSRLSLRYFLFEGFNYELNVAYSMEGTQVKSFLPQKVTGLAIDDDFSNRAYGDDKDEYKIYTKNQLNFTKEIGEIHSITSTLSFYTDDYNIRESSVTKANAPSSALTDQNGGGRTINNKSFNAVDRNMGISFFLHYSLLDRYIIMGGFNREGNSKFDKHNRYILFPSISLAWRVSEESFIKNHTDKFDDFRIKFSYGQTARAPGKRGLFFSNYKTTDWKYLDEKGVYPTSMQLVNMGWEKFTTRNLGTTIEMFKHRILLDFEIYKNTTDDMLFEKIYISSVSGSNQIAGNVGKIDIYGWEYSLRTTPVSRNKLKIDFSFNISENYNVLRELSESYQLTNQYVLDNNTFTEGAQIDNPMGAFYGLIYDGVYQDEEDLIALDKDGNKIYDANGNPIKMIFLYPNIGYEFKPGDAKYRDINHDGNIDYQDIVYLGKSGPDFTGGFGSTIEYGSLKLNIYFYSRVGNDIINKTQMSTENMHGYDNQSKAILSRWRNENTVTDMPRALIGDGYNYIGSTRFVQDGSFVRLKYITLSYRVPSSLAKKMGLKTLSISTTMDNLLTFTKYTGQDPEISIKPQNNNIWSSGYDYSSTPPQRRFTISLSTQF